MPPKNTPPAGPPKPFKMRFSIWWMYASIFAVIFGIVYLDRNEVTKEVSFTEFCSFVERDHGITKIIINTDGKTAQGLLTDSLARKVFKNTNFSEKGSVGNAYVIANISSADDLTRRIDQWRSDGAFTGSVDYEKSSPYGSILITFLPFALLIGFWIWMMRRMSGGAGGPEAEAFSPSENQRPCSSTKTMPTKSPSRTWQACPRQKPKSKK